MVIARSRSPFGVLLDIDGVLYVGNKPIAGAHEALAELHGLSGGLRLVTNTTSRPRRAIVEHLQRLGFEVALEELLTPASMAERHCRERGYRSVALLTSAGLREDFTALENSAFRALMEGAELVALQHNRYWRRADGLALDVGAYAAALEYASGVEAVVVGKPARAFFEAAMADIGLSAGVMIGDDVEADVGGAMAAGLPGVLVRTGKYRRDALTARVTPTAVVDSIKDVPGLLRRMPLGSGLPVGKRARERTLGLASRAGG
jgi:ribonucleotide monophosphatase NagD (HAD superfamily)